MATTTITCPTGLAGRIRNMKVREERILADRKLAKAGGQMDQIVAACWEETLHHGAYDFGTAVDWNKVLQGDRFYALLMIRALSYGPEYGFSVTCSNSSCRAIVDWEVNLNDLPVKLLSDESRSIFVAGNHFEATLPDAGRKVTFRLLTGADEKRIAAQRKANGNEHPITTMLSIRLDSIEGVDARDKKRFIEELAMSDVAFLRSEFDRVDCGVETEIEVECQECYSTTRVELPFDKNFFLPDRVTTPAPTASTPPSPPPTGGNGSSGSAGTNTGAAVSPSPLPTRLT